MGNYRKWVEISKDALKHNFETTKARTDSQVMAVVKANAYGHGLLETTRLFIEYGASYIGVSSLGEALRLREAGINASVLVLGFVQNEDLETAVKNNITISISDYETINALAKLSRKSKVHIKINSGMNRLGFSSIDPAKLKFPNVEIEGVFSHFACEDYDSCKMQYDRFMEISKGLEAKYKHISSSNAIFNFPEFGLDMVRAGLCLYGYGDDSVTPAMKFKAKVVHTSDVPKGEGVSYNWTYKTEKDEKIVSVPVGYADGLPRVISNSFSVKINDKLCPNVGSVCMDLFMARGQASICDEVLIFEDAREIAEKAGMIVYEIICNVGARVPRVYV